MNIKRIASGAAIAASVFLGGAIAAVAVPVNTLETKGAFQLSNTGGAFGFGLISGEIAFSVDRGAIPDFGSYTTNSAFAARTATGITSSVGSKNRQLSAVEAIETVNAALATFDNGVASNGGVVDLAGGGAYSVRVTPSARGANGFEGGFEIAFEVMSQADLDALASATQTLLDPLGLGLLATGVGIDDLSGSGSFSLSSTTDVEAVSQIAPIPVPAGGLLLVTGLGAFAFTRRRKTA
ncbi:VPLPA-CTERM sorting domain-containing protein [Gymnodinialimonas ulvae]|uniref:VPLPA-CTERM sorting domain-containing protein n=1 Tax=Gymnodinialimonas ulvae TaxID=3126504 RepID=UPI0030AD6E52